MICCVDTVNGRGAEMDKGKVCLLSRHTQRMGS